MLALWIIKTLAVIIACVAFLFSLVYAYFSFGRITDSSTLSAPLSVGTFRYAFYLVEAQLVMIFVAVMSLGRW